MTNLWRSTMSILMAVPLLAACDDKRTANAGNFEQVLQHYYDGHPECLALPIDFVLGAPVSADGAWRGQADVLVRAGLLSAVSPNGVSPPSAGAQFTVQYALTATGEQAIRKGADSFLGGMTLCYAHRRITKVTLFTVPAEVLGTTASRVSYQYKLQDVAAWAKSPALQDAFPTIKAALVTPSPNDTDGMVLTDGGWQDERALQ